MRLDILSKNKPDYRLLANALRFLAIDAVEHAKSGHPGLPMGMADVATVLFQDFLIFDPLNPHWPDRSEIRWSPRLEPGRRKSYAATPPDRFQETSLQMSSTRSARRFPGMTRVASPRN